MESKPISITVTVEDIQEQAQDRLGRALTETELDQVKRVLEDGLDVGMAALWYDAFYSLFQPQPEHGTFDT